MCRTCTCLSSKGTSILCCHCAQWLTESLWYEWHFFHGATKYFLDWKVQEGQMLTCVAEWLQQIQQKSSPSPAMNDLLSFFPDLLSFSLYMFFPLSVYSTFSFFSVCTLLRHLTDAKVVTLYLKDVLHWKSKGNSKASDKISDFLTTHLAPGSNAKRSEAYTK